VWNGKKIIQYMKNVYIQKFFNWQSVIYNYTRQFFLHDLVKLFKTIDCEALDSLYDWGCGTALNADYIPNNTVNYLGIDINNAILHQAKKKYPHFNFIQGDISQISIQKSTTLSVSAYTLCMLEPKLFQQALLNIKKHTKKGGRFMILDFYNPKGLMRFFFQMIEVYPLKSRMKTISQIFPSNEVLVLRGGYNCLITCTL
jgi:ubiquinone/menaquinone biosynthesis C-methylase UbiE